MGRPRAEQALPVLQRVASLVKPVMRKRNWRLPVLSEFFPDEPSLLGLNMISGQKILLRLRPPWSPDTFYDEEQLASLTHNVHGTHDDKFYKYLSELETEYETLRRSGYDGEGFHSAGKRLGVDVSHNLPLDLARAKTLQAVEKRKALQQMLGSPGGQRLGGNLPRSSINMSPRELAVQAAQTRGTSKKLARKEAEKAAKDSIEDRADTLEETVSQDYPESSTKETNQFTADVLLDLSVWSCAICTLDNLASATQCLACLSERSARDKRPHESINNALHAVTSTQNQAPLESPDNLKPVHSKKVELKTVDVNWACPTCTLLNPNHFLQCSACSTVRPRYVSKDGWRCMTCGEVGIPNEFWSCRFCGSIKESSSST
ncbi:hypothetical protein A7U60_g4445 [Sanghuangporus baumii]|uniref:RanBP2-type domain-containing protein n=1 Tax=Sanghuangporus baumii TaxID=108892 RepID=A0A9Q5HYN0_SANBA|nr:hypothetical protein A7U60_g4445 [Sanghuangporus baumii]